MRNVVGEDRTNPQFYTTANDKDMLFSLEMNLITYPFVLPLFEHAQPSVHVVAC